MKFNFIKTFAVHKVIKKAFISNIKSFEILQIRNILTTQCQLKQLDIIPVLNFKHDYFIFGVPATPSDSIPHSFFPLRILKYPAK